MWAVKFGNYLSQSLSIVGVKLQETSTYRVVVANCVSAPVSPDRLSSFEVIINLDLGTVQPLGRVQLQFSHLKDMIQGNPGIRFRCSRKHGGPSQMKNYIYNNLDMNLEKLRQNMVCTDCLRSRCTILNSDCAYV